MNEIKPNIPRTFKLHEFNYVRKIDADTIGLYANDLTKMFQIDKGTADTIVASGGLGTGKYLDIKANITDAYPSIRLAGVYVILNANGAGGKISMKASNVGFMEFYENGTDDTIAGTTVNNNIYLKPNGSGVVKFGTKTGTGDTAVDGYISIKDSAGNAVKLATVA